MAILSYMLALTNMVLFLSQLSSAIDIITQSRSLLDDGRTTLVSTDGSFELGFFSPGNSTNRYVGIWFKRIPIRTIIWVANRDKPIKNNSGMLSINTEGHLVLLNQNKTTFWMANSSTKALNPIVQLLGSGNLVLRDEKVQNPLNYLWQSFDYPSNTLIPGMKIGWDLRTGLNRRLTAWKSWDDPSPGDFTWELMLHNFPDGGFWQGPTLYYRSGPWIGLGFSGAPMKIESWPFDLKFVSNKDEVYFTYFPKNKSTISIGVMNQTIYSQENFIWIEEAQSWRAFGYWPIDNCDRYNLCGPYANCVMGKSPICQCLRGFKPKSPRKWDLMDWTEGCVHNETWSCKVKRKDNFFKFSGLKFPDTTHSWVNASMTLEECKSKCWANCSCSAYANSDIREGGSGCAIWFGDLLDMKQISNADQNLYIRMAFTETAANHEDSGNIIKVIVITASILAALVMLFTLLFINKRRRKSRDIDGGCEEEMDLPFYDFTIISRATENFSSDNKLGQGGFGPVYKGKLVDGQEIAVKRLSHRSDQGVKEFKNEVILCAKLQHRNLVKVLGFCIQGEEKMLIYEYMPNRSLDSFIFGSEIQSKLLDWSKRFHIICGVARGLLYLHQDFRLRIIHRDFKASNILLDNKLNPKISDFGLARIFEGDKREQNTNRVVGTYGYMAPEYAFDGIFSTKSDVFSFGLLLLEIVSGIRNKGLSYDPNQSHNLIGQAWRLWKEGSPLKLIDAHLEQSCIVAEVMRCIHISLLCVQHHPDDRPNMTSVVVMLSSEGALPQPREPGFLLRKALVRGECSGNLLISSSNEISITQLEAR